MVTVYRNTDHYTRSNVQVAADGRITAFDKTRTSAGLNGVEIGYALIDSSVLSLQSADTPSMFEDALYPTLAPRRALAFPTDHRYYSIGTPERLPLTTLSCRLRPRSFSIATACSTRSRRGRSTFGAGGVPSGGQTRLKR